MSYRKLALCALLALPCALSAQINVFHESFTGNGVDELISTVGWVGHITRADMGVVGQIVPHNEASPHFPTSGYPSYEGANILASGGFNLFVSAGHSQLVSWTEKATFSLSGVPYLEFSWDSRNTNQLATIQPIFRADGQWYATSATYINPNGDSTFTSISTGQLSLSDPSNWVIFNFDGTTTDDATGIATIGATPAAGISGTIDAVGLFFNNAIAGSGNMRVDNFTIAVPEPSTYALLGGLAVLGFAQLRRRKKQAA